jgi:hypothetical protein
MIVSGVLKTGIGGYSALVQTPAEASLMTPPVNKSITPSVITLVNATADYAMVNESGAIWVNEAGIQMVAQ